MDYLVVKYIYMLFVVLSIVLFYVCFFLCLKMGVLVKNKVVFIGSYSIDILLFVLVVVLIVMVGFNFLE